MGRIALTRASELIHVADTLEYFGESPERILDQLKIPMWHYCDPDDLIPKHHVFMLMERAARTLGSPTFGLLVGEQTRLSSMGSFGSLIANSLTTHDLLSACCRLIPLHNAGSELYLVEAGDEVWFCHRESPLPENGRWHKELFTLMRGIDAVRMCVGPSWRPAKVRLKAATAPGRQLREALGDPEIRIGQKSTAFAFPRSLLAQPLRRSGMQLGKDSELVEGWLRDTAPTTDLVEGLRQLAGTLLNEGTPPRIETMAEITGFSVRSLQRRLARNGITHIQIVDQARYQTATRMLEDSKIRITDIGMELGYADSAHFSRAFKRWAGVTPSEYRSHQLVQ